MTRYSYTKFFPRAAIVLSTVLLLVLVEHYPCTRIVHDGFKNSMEEEHENFYLHKTRKRSLQNADPFQTYSAQGLQCLTPAQQNVTRFSSNHMADFPDFTLIVGDIPSLKPVNFVGTIFRIIMEEMVGQKTQPSVKQGRWHERLSNDKVFPHLPGATSQSSAYFPSDLSPADAKSGHQLDVMMMHAVDLGIAADSRAVKENWYRWLGFTGTKKWQSLAYGPPEFHQRMISENAFPQYYQNHWKPSVWQNFPKIGNFLEVVEGFLMRKHIKPELHPTWTEKNVQPLDLLQQYNDGANSDQNDVETTFTREINLALMAKLSKFFNYTSKVGSPGGACNAGFGGVTYNYTVQVPVAPSTQNNGKSTRTAYLCNDFGRFIPPICQTQEPTSVKDDFFDS